MGNAQKTLRICLFFVQIAICLFFLTANAQNGKIDSLKHELSQHLKNDAAKVNLLNELANCHLERDSVQTMTYLKASQTLAEALGFEKGLARALFLKGRLQLSKSNYSQALEQLDKARSLYVRLDFKEGLAECLDKMGLAAYHQANYRESIGYFKKSIALHNAIPQRKKTISSLKFIGYCFTDMGSYDKAEKYLQEAVELSEEFKDSVEMANSINVIGTLSLHKGNYPLALEHYNRALDLYKKINDDEGVAIVLNNTGIIHKNYSNYDLALDNYKEALQIEKKFGNQKNYAIGLNNIGVVYKQKKDYDNAFIFLKDALRISESINDRENIARCLINLGDVYLALKKHPLALNAFLKAKTINKEIGTQYGLCYSLLGIARVYEKEGHYGLALINAQESKTISENIGLLDYHRDVYEVLSRIYEKTNNYRKAFESHQQFKRLNDSLFNRNKIEKIARLESEYKYKQALDSANIRELKLTKAVMTTSQNLAKTRQNYLWAIIGILLTCLLFGSFVFYQKYRTVKIMNQNVITEQKLLRSQMTPHFIFNSLSVLQGMILNKESEKSISYLSKFSKLLRIVLENSRDKVVPLVRELEAIDNYMILQNMDADPPYDYTLTVDEHIDSHHFLIPPMLIQPFVENAIEHAFTPDQEYRQVALHISFNNKRLNCRITDNGIGVEALSDKTNTKKKSLATTITEERLHMLARDFKTAGGIRIEDRKKDDEQGTRVTLTIPYKIIENV